MPNLLTLMLDTFEPPTTETLRDSTATTSALSLRKVRGGVRRPLHAALVAMAWLLVAPVMAQGPQGRGGQPGTTATPVRLPLDNLGVEHLDIVVPDTAAAAQFYARIFKTPLHQQPVRDTLRYFIVLGDVPADRQVGYIAIGAAQNRPPAIGHYCILAKT